MADIIGFYNGSSGAGVFGGYFLAVEVKTKDDRLSDEQKEFLIKVNKSGGYACIAEDNGDGTVKYTLYK